MQGGNSQILGLPWKAMTAPKKTILLKDCQIAYFLRNKQTAIAKALSHLPCWSKKIVRMFNHTTRRSKLVSNSYRSCLINTKTIQQEKGTMFRHVKAIKFAKRDGKKDLYMLHARNNLITYVVRYICLSRLEKDNQDITSMYIGTGSHKDTIIVRWCIPLLVKTLFLSNQIFKNGQLVTAGNFIDELITIS